MPTDRRRLLAGAIAAAIAAGGCDNRASPYFSSAQRVSRDPATFYANNQSEPEYLDPGKCADGGCSVLVTQLFEGLLQSHPDDGHPVQGVARSWDRSEDNRLFRFHLRPEARWSDGRPVTAGDFEYAWKRTLSPKTASRAASNLGILTNGEDFRLGKLRVLRDAWTLRAEPREDAAAGSRRLKQGMPVAVLDHAAGWTRVAGRRRPFQDSVLSLSKDEQGWVPDALLDPQDGSLVGVRATDDLTLEVELDHPAPYFLDLTTHHVFAPVRRDVIEPFERRGEEDLWTRPESLVSNGPYMLDRWAFQYEITMKENPFYWDRDRLKIRRIVWLEVSDYHATMNLYKAGELDHLGDNVPPPAEYLPLLSGKKDFVHNDLLSVYWYELNTGKPPLGDARVRRALDRAIDKRQLVERITRGGQAPATHYVPDFTGSGYDAQVAADRRAGTDPFAGRGFDPEAARALLAEAGFAPVREGDGWRAPGFPPLEILYNTGEGNRMLAIAIQAMWKEHLGVTASLRNLEWKVMLKAYRDGDFQVVRFGQTADFDHPHTFLEAFLADNPQNHTGWHDDGFDRTLARAAATGDPGESIRLYRAAERIAVDGMSRIPLYFYTRSTLVKPWVKGFRGNKRKPHSIQYLSIDPDWQRGGPDVPAFLPPELPEAGTFLAGAP